MPFVKHLDGRWELGERGYSPIVLVGTDIPTLDPGQLRKALISLQTSDLYLGPSYDGGYYLIGSGAAHRSLFEDVPWGAPEVLSLTIARAKTAALSVALLDTCRDVDTVLDLQWLSGEIDRLSRCGEGRVPRRTATRLKETGL